MPDRPLGVALLEARARTLAHGARYPQEHVREEVRRPYPALHRGTFAPSSEDAGAKHIEDRHRGRVYFPEQGPSADDRGDVRASRRERDLRGRREVGRWGRRRVRTADGPCQGAGGRWSTARDWLSDGARVPAVSELRRSRRVSVRA